jgi:CBS domain-containing protein
MSHRPMLTARDVMVRKLVKLRPDMSIVEAAQVLIRKELSGAPVVDGENHLLGFLSEWDCLRVLASDDFTEEDFQEQVAVSEYMTPHVHTVAPDTGIFSLAHLFVTLRIRKMPVVEDGVLIGYVSRRDVLTGIGRMRKKRLAKSKPGTRGEREPGLYLSATDSSPGVIAKRLK